jgi:hypothetical protein
VYAFVVRIGIMKTSSAKSLRPLFCLLLLATLPDLVRGQEQGGATNQSLVPAQTGAIQIGAGQTNHPAQTDMPAETPAPRPRPAGPTPTLGLDQGFLEFDTPDFNLKLAKASQTIAALEPKGQGTNHFDFTPADQLEKRAGDRYFHLGDLTLRLRTGAAGAWKSVSTAAARRPVNVLPPVKRSPRPISRRRCRRIVRCKSPAPGRWITAGSP